MRNYNLCMMKGEFRHVCKLMEEYTEEGRTERLLKIQIVMQTSYCVKPIVTKDTLCIG